MRGLRTYLQIAWRFFEASVAVEMEYRLNFISSALSSLMTLTGSLFSLSLLFAGGERLADWTWPEAMLVVGAFTVLEGIQASFMTPNRLQISEAVREGQLDFVLLKPIDSQFWMSVRRWSLWGVPNILLGLAVFVYAGRALPEPMTSSRFALAVALLGVGSVILYALGFLLATTSIWFVKLYNLTYAMQALLEAGRYPIPAYPHVYRILFTFVLPVTFMTTVPAQAVVGTVAIDQIAMALAIAAGLFLLSRWFWQFALRSYSSASS